MRAEQHACFVRRDGTSGLRSPDLGVSTVKGGLSAFFRCAPPFWPVNCCVLKCHAYRKQEEASVDMEIKNKATKIDLFSLAAPQMQTFHMTWFAFFLCFFGWFGIAPLMALVGLSERLWQPYHRGYRFFGKESAAGGGNHRGGRCVCRRVLRPERAARHEAPGRCPVRGTASAPGETHSLYEPLMLDGLPLLSSQRGNQLRHTSG